MKHSLLPTVKGLYRIVAEENNPTFSVTKGLNAGWGLFWHNSDGLSCDRLVRSESMTNENIYTQLDQLSEVADNLDRENQRLYYDLDKLQLENQSLRRGLRSLASENQGLNYENQNLNSEIAELHQRVTRLSDLYKLVCEENKELLEELNADKPLEQEASDTADSYVEDRILDNPPEEQVSDRRFAGAT